DFHVTGVQTCALPISRFIPLEADELCKISVYSASIGFKIVFIGSWCIGEILFDAEYSTCFDGMVHFRLRYSFPCSNEFTGSIYRSEERRVGKECRSCW